MHVYWRHCLCNLEVDNLECKYFIIPESMFLPSTFPALTSLLSIIWSQLAAFSSSYGAYGAYSSYRAASKPPCVMWAIAFSPAWTACEYLLFCTFLCLVYPPPLFAILPFSLQNSSVHTSPGKSFVNIHFPLSNLIIFLLLLFMSLLLSFPLNCDISRADTQSCNPRVQHGAHHQIKVAFLKKEYFYWSMLALQFYVIFCCTAEWISHVYTCISSL